MSLGILAIQGSVEEHGRSVRKLGVEPVFVRKVADLSGVELLIIPGGESTTIGKLMWRFGLAQEIIRRFEAGDLAIWGTCAGAILLAKDCGDERVEGLKLMDIVVARNAYGNQLESFVTTVDFAGIGEVPAVFIRAPKIVSVGEGVEVLARHNGDIIAARQGKLLVTTFHPEMTESEKVHEWFLKERRKEG